VRFGVLLALALAAVSAAPASGQTTSPSEPAVDVRYLSRFDFHVSMAHLFSEDPRFVWDADFGGELDMIDYGRGRATFVANYQTILGNEFRAFDPNQGNYILEGSASVRQGGLEAAAVFHHVSRHLSDRPKRFPVDWNMIGVRVSGRTVRGPATLRGRTDVRGVIQKSYVDYHWELESAGDARVAIGSRASLVSSGSFRVLGVDGSRERGTQFGVRGEGGVRLDGQGASLELFIAAERRIDPYQLEFSTARWITAGFRISSPASSRMP
jgi:hypothetical protein